MAFVTDITERKRAERALHESEERLRLAVDSTGVGTFEIEAQTRRRTWSAVTKSFFGLPADAEVTDSTVRALMHRDDYARNQQLVEDALRPGGPGSIATEFRGTDVHGKENWIVIAGKTFFDNKGNPQRLIGVAQDITERRQMEQSLRHKEEGLRLAVESTGIGTFDFDARTRERIWSDIAKSYFGLSPDAQVDDATVRRCIHPDDWDRVQRILEAAVRPGSSGSYRNEFRTIGANDGRIRWISAWGRVLFDQNGECERIIGVLLDFTERKRIEESLRENEERMRLAVTSTGMGTFDFDLRTGKAVCSDIVRSYLGLPPGLDVDVAIFRKCIHPEDRDRVQRLIDDAMRPGNTGHFAAECRTVGLTDGRERWVSAEGQVTFGKVRTSGAFHRRHVGRSRNGSVWKKPYASANRKSEPCWMPIRM